MNQNIWGPSMWFALHTITFNYPIKPKDCDREDTVRFFTNLQDVIPCSVCRKNYKRNLVEFPIQAGSRRDLVRWLIDIHNEINTRTGKRPLTYQEVIDKYEKIYDKKLMEDTNDMEDYPCRTINTRWILYLAIAILCTIIGYTYLTKSGIRLLKKLK